MLWHFIFIATSNVTQWSVQAWNAFVSQAFSGYMLLPNWMLFTYHFLSYSYPYNNNNNIAFFPQASWGSLSYPYPYPILFAQEWRRNVKRQLPPLIRKEIDLIYLDSFKYCFSLFLYDRKVLGYCHFLLHTFLRHVACIIFSMNSLDGSIVPDQHIVVLNVLEYIITWMTLRFLFQIHITSLKVNYVF